MFQRPLLLATLAGGLALAATTAAPIYDVRAFGAKGDGQTVDTAASPGLDLPQ
jgi:polygalacturonase